ncbi:unnamed protein product [Pieris brassicae]|uniref:Peptidase A2 domain-containing protein n=1 Tax=Pieris brassicae TaxID=7116 RepID=A0A9P0TQF5_PIEBR|nr:unnamed protein product [Pieris brassicae]
MSAKHVTFNTNILKPTKSSCAKSVDQIQNKKHTPSPCPTPIIPSKVGSPITERDYPVYEVTTNSQKRYLPHVSLNTQVNPQPLIFLVDTGSCVSLIKKNSITSMPILVDDIIQLKEINSNNETVPTLGHFQLQLFVGIDTNIAYRFHVVEEIDLGYDGIIDTDFLNDLDGIIDYNSDILKVRNFTIKIDYSRPVYKIFPRSETIIECTVSNPEQKVGIILDQHLSDSLLIANCIVSVKNNNRVNISVVNTSEELITLDSDIKVRIQPLHASSFQVDPNITSAKSSISHPGSRLVRWRLKLEEFDYKIEYKKGKINSNADALSRFPVNPIHSPNHDHIPSTTGQSQPSSPITLEDLGEIPLIPIESDSLPSVDLLDNEDPLTDLLNPEDSPQNDDPLNPQTTQNPEEIPNPSSPIPANSSMAQQFIEQMVNSPGIYFDPIGSLNQIDSYLSVVPVIIQYEDMTRYSEAIPNLASHHSTKRSALVGVIGTISKKLFGTMDEEDAMMAQLEKFNQMKRK